MGDYALPPRISVDTKKGMQEIYSDIVSDHERFRNECIRAQEDGIRLVILIEDEEIKSLDDARKWVNPREVRYWKNYAELIKAQKSGLIKQHRKIPKPPVPSERLVGMMDAMHQKYGVEWAFCNPRNTAETIIKILTERSD